MKYSVDIIIKKPREKVVKLFSDPTNMPKWMEGLVSYVHLGGEHGKEGAKTRFVFKMGNKVVEMIETVIKSELPDLYSVSYQTEAVYNIVTNRFEETNDGHTRCIADQEFKFNSFMLKLYAFLFPSSFKKQSLKYLNALKYFIENHKE